MRFAIDPPDEDRYDEVNPDHEADEIRRQAWDLFVACLRDYAATFGWMHILWAANRAYLDDIACMCIRDIHEFAEGYGWPDTLRAIAQAMQADETLKKELDARR